jgi:hypothetical protein
VDNGTGADKGNVAMMDAANDEQRNEREAPAGETPNTNPGIPLEVMPRRLYRAPQLRRLGSVRDLTWGGSGGGPDDFGEQLP